VTFHGDFWQAIHHVGSARCDALVRAVWVATPARRVLVTQVLGDCIVRLVCSRPHGDVPERPALAALAPLRDANARRTAREVLVRGMASPLDRNARLVLTSLENLDQAPSDPARMTIVHALFKPGGVIPMAFRDAKGAGVREREIEELVVSALEGLIRVQVKSVTVEDASALEATAKELIAAREAEPCVRLCLQAADARRALGDGAAQFHNLTNASAILQLSGDLQGSLEVVEDALALPVASPGRPVTAMNRAGLLDKLDRPSADAWLEAAEVQTTPHGRAFCKAHALGAAMKHGPDCYAELAGLLQRTELTAAHRAGVIGGAGDSAGPRGVPLLAQAVLVCCGDPQAWIGSTAPFWERLMAHVDLSGESGLALAGLGWMLTAMRGDGANHDQLRAISNSMLARCANARSVRVEQLSQQLLSDGRRLFEVAVQALTQMVPPAARVPLAAPAATAVPRPPPGPSRVSRCHPRWVSGQFADYVLERADGTWVAIGLSLVDQDPWLVVAEVKDAAREVHGLLEYVPRADSHNASHFVPKGFNVQRGIAEPQEALAMLRPVIMLLDVADLAGAAEHPAARAHDLPCRITEVRTVEIPTLDYVVRHELSARVPITGVARSRSTAGSPSLVIAGFGTRSQRSGPGDFDDHIDLANRRRIEHGDFAWTYPATWMLRAPEVEPALDGRGQHDVRELHATSGGNSLLAHATVTVFSGAPDEIARLEADFVARAQARGLVRGGALVPEANFAVADGHGFLHTLEHPDLDGFMAGAMARSPSRTCLAVARVALHVLKSHPMRGAILAGARQPLQDIVGTIEAVDVPAGAARKLVN
jgi:hypothetical protein